jgi:hypothetical protein
MKYLEGSNDSQLKDVELVLSGSPVLHLLGDKPTLYLGKDPKDILLDIIIRQRRRATVTDSNVVQCDNNDRKRSQSDLYCLMRYYYPEITLKQLRSLLLELARDGEISSLRCGWIQKRVYYIPKQFNTDLVPPGYIRDHKELDEFKLKYQDAKE